MARKPARRPARKSASTSARSADRRRCAPAGDRDKIIAAFLALLAEKRIEQIGFAEIAEARRRVAGANARRIPVRRWRSLRPHLKSVDRAVLAEDMADMAEEPPRERLFDVLMRRLEVLAPHREAVRSLLRSARRNPPLALALNGLAVRSQQWMLTAAGIKASGPRGMMRAQGLAVHVRFGVAHLGQGRRSGSGAHHGGARPGARARPAFCRLARRPLPRAVAVVAGCGRAGAAATIATTMPRNRPPPERGR